MVDEEHDTSYKQDDGLRYHARDLAVVRAKFANARVVLASATPSLETRNNAKTNKYGHLLLTNRFGLAVLPNIESVSYTHLDVYKRQLEDLADEFGVSRERIRQIEVRAFEKLQEAMKALALEKGLIEAA